MSHTAVLGDMFLNYHEHRHFILRQSHKDCPVAIKTKEHKNPQLKTCFTHPLVEQGQSPQYG